MIDNKYSIYIKGLLNKDKHYIDKNEKNRVGRTWEESNIYLDDQLISRRHAEIIFENNQFHIIDLNSQNGTFVNKIKAIPFKRYELKNNDLIGFAQNQYRFYIEDETQMMKTENIKVEFMQIANKDKICIKIRNPESILEYQFLILSENKNVNLIYIDRVSDSTSEVLYYDVTGLNSLGKIVHNGLLKSNEFVDIVLKIVKVIQDTEKLLLNKESFILSLHTIFFPCSGDIKLIYVPVKNEERYTDNLKKLLIKLIDEYVEYEESFKQEMIAMISSENIEMPDILEKIVWENKNSVIIDKKEEYIQNKSHWQRFYDTVFLKIRRLIMTK